MLRGINHVTLSVNDVDESFEFYVSVLGCKPIQKSPISAYVLAGDVWVALDKSQHDAAAPSADFSHLAFTVAPDDFEHLRTRLAQSGVVSWTENFTEGDSYYFLDPNGHKLEIAVSNLANRIEDGKKNWGPNTQWFV